MKDLFGISTLKKNRIAVTRKPFTFSFVWLIPILALIVTAMLLWKNSFDKGELITVYCDDASGMEAGKTLVKFRSVTVGKVEKVALSSDHSKVELKVRIDEDEKDLLRSDTIFYVVKPRVQSANISGLDTILTGNYIQLSQGISDEPGREFTLLDNVPATASDTNALHLTLISNSGRRISYGDPVSYRGFVVGSVNGAELDVKSGLIKYKVIIDSKYRHLVTSRSVFWINSGLDFSMGVQGISFRTENLQNLLSSGITFDDLNDHEELAECGKILRLFENFKEASGSVLENRPHFVLMMDNSSGAIAEGSLVKTKGAVIGRVVDSPWYENAGALLSSERNVPVRIALSIKGLSDEKVLNLTNQALKEGRLCASLVSTSLLTGLDTVKLEFGQKKQCKSKKSSYRGDSVIPVIDSQTLDKRLEDLSKKMSTIDFQGISDGIVRDLKTMNELMKEWRLTGRELRASGLINHASSVSEELEGLLKELNGHDHDVKNKGLVGELSALSEDIREILKELRPIFSQMSQQPNSLIFNKGQEDPEPGSIK
ncbi:MAG TPA: hypothetical protein DCL74_05055 [Succinivibrionaceae bacterium]|nr:hypothetical protein [Succinivibrionaceae bacterium]